MDSLEGHLLVASPYLGDSNFNKAVVLIIQHTQQGAMGVVLNRPSQKTVRDVWDEIGNEPCESSQVVDVGGPVDGLLMAIHTLDLWSEHQVIPGVHVATQKDKIDKIIRQSDHPFRIYGGYAGWGASQLEYELEQGAWFTMPARFDHIFYDRDADLWKDVAHDIGRENVLSKLNIKHAPTDPSMT